MSNKWQKQDNESYSEYRLRVLRGYKKRGRKKKQVARKPIVRKSLKYAEYIKSKKWEKRRAKFLTKSPFCIICETRERLHVHHVRYTDTNGSILGRERDSDLRTLCEGCHNKVHYYGYEKAVRMGVSIVERDELLRLPEPSSHKHGGSVFFMEPTVDVPW